MGNSPSHPIFLALNELLRSKNLKLKKSTLGRFLEECDTTAPWFAVSRKLTTPSWEKLGRDLEFAAEQGTLKVGVRSIWKLVRSCLSDQRCGEAVENGQATLEMLQEERSEKEASEKAQSERSKRKDQTKLYPSLSELDESDHPDSSQSGRDSGSEDDEEAIEAARRAFERVKLHRKGTIQKDQDQKRHFTPTAPPPYLEAREATAESCQTESSGFPSCQIESKSGSASQKLSNRE